MIEQHRPTNGTICSYLSFLRIARFMIDVY